MPSTFTICINEPSSKIHINLYDNYTATTYKDLLEQTINEVGICIDNQRCFEPYSSKSQLQEKLLNAIDTINNFCKTEYIELPKQIDWNNKEFYNMLHVYFEKLNGTWIKPTNLMLVGPEKIKNAVRDLNYIVHELESYSYSSNHKDTMTWPFKLQWSKGKTTRRKFTQDQYNEREFEYKKNKVYLGYNEVGKEFIELALDNLDINYPNAKNNHYIGLDIIFAKQDCKLFETSFLQWCKKNNFDPYKKSNGIGLAPIGTYYSSGNMLSFSPDSKITNIILG
jgi:hypothetical protein|tara:strand:+ start:392 stop:1234 length:843 start_codon:yes stop_codon:yes gene_type:complete